MTTGADLLDEKSLWEIYRQCIQKLPPSKFNLFSTALFFLVLICDVSYFPENFQYRLDLTRSLSDAGLGFGTTILGFLIAGFTIFSTLSKPELFRRMYDAKHQQSGLSYLKVNFFTFAEVFVVYAVFLTTCLTIKILGSNHGLLSSIVKSTTANPIYGYSIDKEWVINVMYVTFGTLSFYSLISLKSFIFNTYHTVMTSIVWSFNQKGT
jgi:hypothetical protein